MVLHTFSDELTSPEAYIEQITYAIWEQRGVHRICDWYAADCPVHTPHGVTNSVEDVIKHTLETMQEFPDRDLLAEDIIIGEKAQGFLSSHRVRSPAVHSGDGTFGPATGKSVYRLAIADCLCQDNQVVAEWLLADQAAVAVQMGIDPVAFGRDMGNRNPSAYTVEHSVLRERWAAPSGELEIDGDKGIATTIIETLRAIWNDRNLHIISERYDRAVRFEGFAGQVCYGRPHLANLLTTVLASIPDGEWNPYHVIVRQQPSRPVRVAVRWSLMGTHSGQGRYGTPTGVPLALMGITHMELRDGRIAAEWLVVDETAVYAQLAAHNSV
ncbi:MAG: ester cyclase [Chloroflexota bacterium]